MRSVAERLRELKGGMSDAEFARLCGIKDSSVRQYLEGPSVPSLKNLIAIGHATGASLDWIATGQGRKSSAILSRDIQIPRLAFKASAGSGALAFEEENIPLTFPAELLRRLDIRPQNARALVAQGTSMVPTISDGDTMVLDVAADQLVDGKVYAFTVADEAFVKRLSRGFRQLIMISDNQDFPDVPIPREEPFRIIGQVKWAERLL